MSRWHTNSSNMSFMIGPYLIWTCYLIVQVCEFFIVMMIVFVIVVVGLGTMSKYIRSDVTFDTYWIRCHILAYIKLGVTSQYTLDRVSYFDTLTIEQSRQQANDLSVVHETIIVNYYLWMNIITCAMIKELI